MRDQQNNRLAGEEASQQQLRDNIELSKRLIEQSDRLMRRERGAAEAVRSSEI